MRNRIDIMGSGLVGSDIADEIVRLNPGDRVL
jgi:hypothetical protein